MSIFGLPLILFKTLKGGKLSDIEFLSIKEFEGKVRKIEGFLSAIGDLATLTANTGKDMYIARAKVIFYANSSSPGAMIADKAELKINGVTVETATSTMIDEAAADTAGVLTLIYEFKNIGHKVAATQIIKLEVITLAAETDVEGFIECFEEDTGTSPQIPSI